ncbi:MAG: hypothetical protein P8O79_12015 [Halieaceae bacterium]|jgi:hypothetical protein|nr:hypothetical protein [Halieaceae bacterium]
MEVLLPEIFSHWQVFVRQWTAADGDSRLRARLSSSFEERERFFTACSEKVPDALKYLDRCPVATWTEGDHLLMNLLLNLAHVALAVETQGDAEKEHARFAQYMYYTQTPRLVTE